MKKFANIDECLSWLEQKKYIRQEMNLGLERIKLACQLLGNPEQKQKTIHITGTNGKGSTAAFLAEILVRSGLKAGSFTSPHLMSWNERIKVNNSLISDDDFFATTFQILDKLKRKVKLTIFEFLTVVALYYFAEVNPVDIVIYEVGMGGKYDATNVILPLVSIITNIDYDHFDYLGSKLKEIAEEKAGIMKEKIPCFTTETRPTILAFLRKKAKIKKSKLVKIAWPKRIVFDHNLTTSFQFYSKNKQFFDIKMKMMGQHQVKNACLAIEVADFLRKDFLTINNKSIQKGIAKTFWPNRLEVIKTSPLLLIDGAHNYAGIKSLISAVTSLFPEKRPIFFVSILKDKQVERMLNTLKKVAYHIVFTEMPNARSQEISKLKKNNTSKFRKMADCQKAFDYFYSLLNEQTVGIITGSLFFTAFCKRLEKW